MLVHNACYADLHYGNNDSQEHDLYWSCHGLLARSVDSAGCYVDLRMLFRCKAIIKKNVFVRSQYYIGLLKGWFRRTLIFFLFSRLVSVSTASACHLFMPLYQIENDILGFSERQPASAQGAVLMALMWVVCTFFS